jgi:hypothetical protein
MRSIGSKTMVLRLVLRLIPVPIGVAPLARGAA